MTARSNEDRAPLAACDALAMAAAALDEQGGPAALERLLEAWRACRSARIAALIDGLSARLGSKLPGVPERDFHAAWLELARDATAADIPRLLPGLMRAPLGDKLIDRVRVLAMRAPDPRIAAGLMAMVDEPPATSQSIIGKLWGPIFTALETIGDGRQREALDRRLRRKPGDSKFWPQHYRKIEGLLKKLPAPHEPDDLEELLGRVGEGIERLDAASATPPTQRSAAPAPTRAARTDDPRSLVYAEPTSIEARLVCADRLLELGDPSGELILLQKKILDGKGTAADLKKERDLIRQHGERLVPPELVPVLTAKQYGFHLGFLGDCEVVFPSDAQVEALVAHPAWRTVRELYTDELALLTRPDLVALDCVGSFDGATLATLAGGEHQLPVTRVGPIYTPSSSDVLTLERTTPRALPHVRALELLGGGGFEAFQWLVGVPLARQLKSLSLMGEVDASFVQAFEALPELEHIDFAGSQRCYRLERVDGKLGLWIGMHDSRLDKLMVMNEHHAHELRRIMSALRRAGVSSFVLADALVHPLKKALPVLAAELGIPHVPERNAPRPTWSDLSVRDGGRRQRQERARAKRRPRPG